jgi:Flp pilus assembly CpaF family ATPase
VTAQANATGIPWPLRQPEADGPIPHVQPSVEAEPLLRTPCADLGGNEYRAAAGEIFRGCAEALAAAGDRGKARKIADGAVRSWALQHTHHGGVIISPATQARLVQAVLDEAFGLGPLQPYLDDPRVENVNINGPGRVWVQLRGGGKFDAGPIASTDQELIAMVQRWGARHSNTVREFSYDRPMMNASIGPGVRLSAVMAVTKRVHISVRFHRQLDVTLDDLAGAGYQTLTPHCAYLLRGLVAAHRNLIVTGGVDAGKTTLLRACAFEIDPDERIAVLETDSELELDQQDGPLRDVVALEARQANSEGAGAVTLHQMIPQALRLNPRRIIVGEVRDTEILSMLEAMNTGHPGSMATIHANSAGELFDRIQMLAQRGQLAIAAAAIHLAVGLSRPFVAHIRKDSRTGTRYVSEVIEVTPVADGPRPARNRVFAPGPDGRAEYCASISDEAARDLADAGFPLTALGGGRR